MCGMMSEKRFDIIGVGSPVVDGLVQVTEEFVSGIEGAKGGMELVDGAGMAKLLGEVEADVMMALGGSAGNTIFGVTRLGLKSTFLGKLGNCEAGTFFRKAFEEAGGDGSRFKAGEIPNARCLSLITPDSERTMRTDLGASAHLRPDEVRVEDFAGVRHAHVEGYMLFNRELMMRVLECAKEAGCTVSVDLASFEVVRASKDVLEDLLRKYVDVVFANEEEADAFTGMGKDYEGMAKRFGELCEVAAVKMGKKGAYVSSKGEVVRIEPVVVERAVDTTGAGDLWAAGFLYGWLTGKSLEDAGRFGSILGAEVVQVMGASLGVDDWEGRIKPHLLGC